MGRLEDELESIRQELENLNLSRVTSGRERQEHLEALIGAITTGEGVEDFDPDEVNRVEEVMVRYRPAFETVVSRLQAKDWVPRGDGTWGPRGTD